MIALGPIAILVCAAAIFGWVNSRFLRLPGTIALSALGFVTSVAMLLLDNAFPGFGLYDRIVTIVERINFSETVMRGMLGFLLFAGALHVDVSELRNRRWAIAIMATIGTAASTLIIGYGAWLIALSTGYPLSLLWALVFGSLISPTDPVAVLSTLKRISMRNTIRTDMSGESLFNDGIAIVLFTLLLSGALNPLTDGSSELLTFVRLFLVEVVGGSALGLVTGYVAFLAMKSIDDYPVEILISLALVMATYAAAENLHVSGPLAVVVAGLLIGNHGITHAMSATTRENLLVFWTLIDEILNSLLFLLIGLEVVAISFNWAFVAVGLSLVPVVLIARFLSVAAALVVLRKKVSISLATPVMLTWGAIRGGICIALALSLPAVVERPLIVTATYVVALFTIVVQGLTLGPVARRLAPQAQTTR